MSKVAIIGGGIAGLTAGILLQKKGIETEIYEKNPVAGGQCMGWNRKGYHIDNCIHWLTGTKKGTNLYELWEEVGALGDDVEIYEKPSFFTCELNGQSLTLWRDKEKTRQELLALSPEDANEINKFIDMVKLAESATVPTEKPFDAMNFIDYIKMGMSMKDMGAVMKEYGGINIAEFGQRFKHPLIQKAVTYYMPPGYQAYAFIVSYATITSGNGDIPVGGSLKMVNRMVDKYQSLGGILHLSSPVKRIDNYNAAIKSIILENDEIVNSEKIILACDTSFTFNKLLPATLMPKQLKKQYDAASTYPVHSGFQVAFAVDGAFPELDGTRFIGVPEITIGKSRLDVISTSSYAYEALFAPENHFVLQTNIVQEDGDFDYWTELYKDKEAYKLKKSQLAQEIMDRIVEHYPQLAGHISVLDVWTPVTYVRYCNSYKGAYMSFTVTKNGKSIRVPHMIKGTKNIYLASQWQMGPGGLPTALAMGKFAAWHVAR